MNIKIVESKEIFQKFQRTANIRDVTSLRGVPAKPLATNPLVESGLMSWHRNRRCFRSYWPVPVTRPPNCGSASSANRRCTSQAFSQESSAASELGPASCSWSTSNVPLSEAAGLSHLSAAPGISVIRRKGI